METLERLCADLAALHPGAARLALDCWLYGQRSGESEGLAMARTLLAGVREYVAHKRALRPLALSPAGAVLGVRFPPPGAHWWLGAETLPTKVKPRLCLAEEMPGWAGYWADTAEGWWRIPVGETARSAA